MATHAWSQAALDLTAEQQEAQVANTASMLSHFVRACEVHRALLEDMTRLPMTAPGCRPRHDTVWSRSVVGSKRNFALSHNRTVE